MGRQVDRECPVCAQVYAADETRLRHGRQTTCSRECSYRLRATLLTTAETFACASCGAEVSRVPAHRKSTHGAEYCSRACHYNGRSAGLTKRVVTEPYDIPPETRAKASAGAALRYASGGFATIPETEIRTSAALGAAGIVHVHQHVIDLGDRSVAVDLFFPDRRLVIELDEPSLHRKPRFAAKDAKRDADLVAAGYIVKRVLDDRNVPAILARVLQALA